MINVELDTIAEGISKLMCKGVNYEGIKTSYSTGNSVLSFGSIPFIYYGRDIHKKNYSLVKI